MWGYLDCKTLPLLTKWRKSRLWAPFKYRAIWNSRISVDSDYSKSQQTTWCTFRCHGSWMTSQTQFSFAAWQNTIPANCACKIVPGSGPKYSPLRFFGATNACRATHSSEWAGQCPTHVCVCGSLFLNSSRKPALPLSDMWMGPKVLHQKLECPDTVFFQNQKKKRNPYQTKTFLGQNFALFRALNCQHCLMDRKLHLWK